MHCGICEMGETCLNTLKPGEIFLLIIWVNIGSDNGLLPGR